MPLVFVLTVASPAIADPAPVSEAAVISCDKSNIECRKGLVDRLAGFAAEKAAGNAIVRAACLREGLDQLQAELNGYTSLDAAQIKCSTEPQDASAQYQKGVEELLGTAKSRISVSQDARITFGVPATECDFPNTVSITGSAGLCTGTLVDSRTVLTAAHCVCDLRLSEDLYANTVFSIRVKATHQVDDGKPGAGLDPAKPPKTFRGWSCQNRFSPPDWGRDVAVLFLDRDLQPPSANVCSRPVPAKIAPTGMYLSPYANVLTVVGFGRDENVQIGLKKWANIPIVSKICGDDISRAKFKCLPGREAVLADPQLRRDTCGGDSGGPVFVKSEGTYFITAVTSRAAVGNACGPGGIYTLITPAVVNWMKGLGVNASYE